HLHLWITFVFLFIFSQTVIQIKPGETLSLSCRGSGFTYEMNWIRHTGKPLVWMGYISSGGSRTEISRDNSKSMVYLKLSGVTAEDSAVYHCARYHSDTE
uniref:Ig-like domain-containing protein n=1 Tax=Astyanax mexicanus TaxID=7994 RepID=A0A3B1JLL3_ASTMX